MSLEGKTPEEIQALAALSDDLLSDPKYQRNFKQLLKAKNPSLSMPDIDLENMARAEFAKDRQEIEALKQERAQDKAQAAANDLYESLREAGTVKNRAGFSALVKFASENGFLTTEMGLKRAAQQMEIESAAAEPTPMTVGPRSSFQISDDNEVSASYMKDPVGTARKRAAEAMDEMRKARAAGAKLN